MISIFVGIAASVSSLVYAARVWPATTVCLVHLICVVFAFPGLAHMWTYLLAILLGIFSILLAWRGDDFLDLFGKAAFDIRIGWKDLFTSYLDHYPDFEYVPIDVKVAEGRRPVTILPGGMPAYLPPMGEILAYWVRWPPAAERVAAKLPRLPRAYPFASYDNFVFVPFDPRKATPQQRFQLYHELGHALYARSYAAIGNIQTWPCLLLLAAGSLAWLGLEARTTLTLFGAALLWQSVVLFRSMPSFERARSSELFADFYAVLHLRDDADARAFAAFTVEAHRSADDPVRNRQAEDLSALLETFKPDSDACDGSPRLLGLDQAAAFQRLVSNFGSQHPAWLSLLLLAALGIAGASLPGESPVTMFAVMAAYAVVAGVFWIFGSGRRNARQRARALRFLSHRRPEEALGLSLTLSFS